MLEFFVCQNIVRGMCLTNIAIISLSISKIYLCIFDWNIFVKTSISAILEKHQVNKINQIFVDELKKRVQQPASSVENNEELREYWITNVIDNVDKLEEKIKFMENERINKSKDTLQATLTKARIDEIFYEYGERSMLNSEKW